MPDVVTTAFSRVTSVPYSIRKSLLEKWSGAEGVLKAAREKLGTAPEEESALRQIAASVDLQAAEKEVAILKKLGAWVIGLGEPGYPAMLAEIPDPPLVLFGLGKLPEATCPHLGFVGPRKPSTYGARIARMLAADLASEGIILVSGLARGIDAIAHEEAVKKRTPTIAVVACGLDRTYPPEHALLSSQVAEVGAVVTEFHPNEPPRAEHFPQRNRVISGLCRGVLVIEAGEKSGARITARHAMEQSRDVFAVPGPIDSSLSVIPNRLISEGAKLVATSRDILEEIVPGFSSEVSAKKGNRALPDLSEEERKLLNRMERDRPVSAEDLVEGCQLAAAEVLRGLSSLQIKGCVEKQADARYVRTVGEW